MGTCARCSTAEFMKKQGSENFIEIDLPPDIAGWTSHRQYRKLKKFEHIDKSTELIVYQDETYCWTSTVFSNNHSLDEDCMVGMSGMTKDSGFPTHVAVDQVVFISKKKGE